MVTAAAGVTAKCLPLKNSPRGRHTRGGRSNNAASVVTAVEIHAAEPVLLFEGGVSAAAAAAAVAGDASSATSFSDAVRCGILGASV